MECRKLKFALPSFFIRVAWDICLNAIRDVKGFSGDERNEKMGLHAPHYCYFF
jgi:hypothetical protein